MGGRRAWREQAWRRRAGRGRARRRRRRRWWWNRGGWWARRWRAGRRGTRWRRARWRRAWRGRPRWWRARRRWRAGRRRAGRRQARRGRIRRWAWGRAKWQGRRWRAWWRAWDFGAHVEGESVPEKRVGARVGGFECPAPGDTTRSQHHASCAAAAFIPETTGAGACSQGRGQRELLLPHAPSGEYELLDSRARLCTRPGAQSCPALVAWQGGGQGSRFSRE